MYLSVGGSHLLLYDSTSWDLKKTYWCYEGILRDVSWSDDSKYILQVNAKGLVEILSPADHEVRSLQHIPLKETWSASFHRDGHRNIAIGTKSGNVMVWDTKNKTIIKTFPTPLQQTSVTYVSYNSKNTSLAASMANGDTIIYGLVSNIPVMTVKLLCSKSISAMKFHHESRSLLGLATDEGHVVLRDVITNKDRVIFENAHASPVSDFAYSLINKDVMFSCGFDKKMHVYDVRLQNIVSTIRTSHTLTCIATNSENQVALGSKNGTVLIYDLRNLSEPLKTVKGKDEEVRRVAFQPIRKKSFSTEVSIQEDKDTIFASSKMHTQAHNRSSDMFYVNNDTPPKNNLGVPAQGENNDDSFLVMMELNKSNYVLDEEEDKVADFGRATDKFESRYNQLDSEKNISKVSTPLSAKTAEHLAFPSPMDPINGVPGDGSSCNNNLSAINELISNQAVPSNLQTKDMDELKYYIKNTFADVSDENKNYFLHIMMALTKQKLFLEKQLVGINEQMEKLALNQNALLETNRSLALEIDLLKNQNNSYS